MDREETLVKIGKLVEMYKTGVAMDLGRRYE